MTLRQHAVGGVMTYEREAGKGYHTLWLGAATRVEVCWKSSGLVTPKHVSSFFASFARLILNGQMSI